MVGQIKVIDVPHTEPEANEEANEPTNTETDTEQASESAEPTLEANAATTELPNEAPSEEPAKKPMLNMPITQKILQQVECQACKRKMSAKTLSTVTPNTVQHAKGRNSQTRFPSPNWKSRTADTSRTQPAYQ